MSTDVASSERSNRRPSLSADTAGSSHESLINSFSTKRVEDTEVHAATKINKVKKEAETLGYYECPSCDKYYNNKKSLRAHWARVDRCRYNLDEDSKPSVDELSELSSSSLPEFDSTLYVSVDSSETRAAFIHLRSTLNWGLGECAHKINLHLNTQLATPKLLARFENDEPCLSSAQISLEKLVSRWIEFPDIKKRLEKSKNITNNKGTASDKEVQVKSPMKHKKANSSNVEDFSAEDIRLAELLLETRKSLNISQSELVDMIKVEIPGISFNRKYISDLETSKKKLTSPDAASVLQWLQKVTDERKTIDKKGTDSAPVDTSNDGILNGQASGVITTPMNEDENNRLSNLLLTTRQSLGIGQKDLVRLINESTPGANLEVGLVSRLENKSRRMSAPSAAPILQWLQKATGKVTSGVEEGQADTNPTEVVIQGQGPSDPGPSGDHIKKYTHFCLTCEEKSGIWASSGTDSPKSRIPVNRTSHKAATGHSKYSDMFPLMTLSSVPDLAYSKVHGQEVRSSWKISARQNVVKVDYYTETCRCKVSGCPAEFPDPVTAFKHIRDKHLPRRGEKRKLDNYEDTLVKMDFPEEYEKDQQEDEDRKPELPPTPAKKKKTSPNKTPTSSKKFKLGGSGSRSDASADKVEASKVSKLGELEPRLLGSAYFLSHPQEICRPVSTEMFKEDSNLPKGWRSYIRDGGKDMLFLSPENLKLRSKTNVLRYMEAMGTYSPKDFAKISSYTRKKT